MSVAEKQAVRDAHNQKLLDRAKVVPPPPQGTPDHSEDVKQAIIKGQLANAKEVVDQGVWAHFEGRFVVFHGDDASRVLKTIQDGVAKKQEDIKTLASAAKKDFRKIATAQVELAAITLEDDEVVGQSEGAPYLALHRDSWTARAEVLRAAGLHVTQVQ